MHTRTRAQNTDLEQLARKRASAKIGWYIHASIYVLVNLVLALLSAMSGRYWAIFPAVGWGFGLAIHGIVVFLRIDGAGLHERMVQRERQRLAQSDPW
jgi:hypothetical protein